MRRWLAALVVVVGVILGVVVSIASPFGVGDVIVRRPIVLLQNIVDLVARALFG